MTIEDLLGMSADELEAMSDEQKKQVLSQYFNVTRPEFAPRVASSERQVSVAEKAKFSAKMEKLKALGLDLTDVVSYKRKNK